MASETPIQPLLVGESIAALQLAEQLKISVDDAAQLQERMTRLRTDVEGFSLNTAGNRVAAAGRRGLDGQGRADHRVAGGKALSGRIGRQAGGGGLDAGAGGEHLLGRGGAEAVAGAEEEEVGQGFYSGLLTCFFHGISCCLFFSVRSARISLRRVPCGMITSSM